MFNGYEAAEEYRYTPQYKAIYDLHKETIERVFGDAKEKHGMCYTQLRGLLKVKMHAFTFACINLKKLAIWKHFNGAGYPISILFSCFFLRYFKKGALAAA